MLTGRKKQIYDYIEANGSATPAEMKAHIGVDLGGRLTEMVREGILLKNDGKYMLSIIFPIAPKTAPTVTAPIKTKLEKVQETWLIVVPERGLFAGKPFAFTGQKQAEKWAKRHGGRVVPVIPKGESTDG